MEALAMALVLPALSLAASPRNLERSSRAKTDDGPARLVFLAPDMDDSSHGGEANNLSTSLIPSLAMVGITDFAVEAQIRVPAVVNGSQRWNETMSGQFSDVCTSEARPWQSCTTGNCTACDPLSSTECRTCFFPRLLGAAGVSVMPQLYFFNGELDMEPTEPGTVPPWACTVSGQISDGHCAPMRSSVNPSPAAFSWFDDAFWADVAATFASAASFTCDSGGRSITTDQEGYFGYMRCPNASAILPWGVNCSVYYGRQTKLSGPFDGNSMGHEGVIRAWNWLPNSSVTHSDRESESEPFPQTATHSARVLCSNCSNSRSACVLCATHRPCSGAAARARGGSSRCYGLPWNFDLPLLTRVGPH
jgi:hypothetical protein